MYKSLFVQILKVTHEVLLLELDTLVTLAIESY